jgi:anti-sigma B factor antagonist
MQIDIAQQGPATVVAPSGPRLDAEVAPEFRTALLQLIDKGRGNLIVNLHGVDFIDSSGLGALVAALKRVKQSAGSGDIRLANVNPPVMAVLEIIRLHRVFPRYPSVDDAVESYS